MGGSGIDPDGCKDVHVSNCPSKRGMMRLQPRELLRHVRRTTDPATTSLALTIAADHTNRDPSTLDPRWIAQLDEMELPDAGPTGWLAAWAARRHAGGGSIPIRLVHSSRRSPIWSRSRS